MTRICDLPPALVGKIFTGIPITCLSAVRSTCKTWKSLSKDWIVGKAVARQHEFLGFMTMGSNLCSVRFHLHLVDLSIKEVASFHQVEISKVFHLDGLVLCVTKDKSSLVVWNPYLEQKRCIKPRRNFHSLDIYAIGYDNRNHNHKILRIFDGYDTSVMKQVVEYEIYDFSSNSWRVLDVSPDWKIDYHQRGATLKGNTYFFTKGKSPREKIMLQGMGGEAYITEYEDFLLCFDFTSEKFGKPLDLPFHALDDNDTVALSPVGEEGLAILFQEFEVRGYLEIWITNKIEPNTVWWSEFLVVDSRLLDFQFMWTAGSFFIDEEKKVAVVFEPNQTTRVPTAYVMGENGCFKSVSLGQSMPRRRQEVPLPLVSSFYLPSLVQIKKKQRRKRKKRRV